MKVISLLKINGFYLSFLLHIILLILLSSQFNHKQSSKLVKTKNKEPIKSFLYTSNRTDRDENSKEKMIIQTKEKQVNKNKSSATTQKKIKQKVDPSFSSKQNKHIKKITNNTLPNTKVIITKQSLIDQANALNTTISNHPVYKNNSTVKSIFNPPPTLVTKSNTRSELQKEYDEKLKVTNYGDGIAIKKNKDGNCSVTQDLSSVGIEGVSATQYFKCGKNEFDINFDHHMKKAMEKYK